ncbi:LysR family transcriptional regulator [Amycolatopsis australiensis]|uniref:ModE molybdate transport repressor domain-containing protein n=1 Tax=Amycolatopsis australiensis TaxID=546364 RepID=A0A1K1SST9_9PSEU|nr:LysR substrate-binding domain-containing protein [Amycolatopsis australiensis]SFW87370.1 ModE molybdate transport repressor domain-containing protein [Amycolatopsis australiensis]
MLDAHRLALLAEVAHAGSIAGAAQRLSFTPSAVSQQVAKLERDVGAPVLHRNPRGVTLTPVGEALLSHAETIVGELRTAERTVRALLAEEPAQLTVGTFASAGMTLVPAALAGFRRDHPAVALRLLDLEPPDGYGLVRSRDLDLLITHRYPGTPLPDPRGLERSLLCSERFRLVLPAGHPLARLRRLTLRALAGEDWISGSPGVPNRVCLEELAAAAGIRLTVAYETRDYQVILALVEAGLGVAYVPESVLGRAGPTRIEVRDAADARPARDIFLVHHRRPGKLVTEMADRLSRPAGRRSRNSPRRP